MIEINDDVTIDEDELVFTTARSSGPGGQHVNKTETRVVLRFDVEGSAALGDEQKALVRSRLATRIGKDGVLRVSSQRHRSQAANRDAARERFAELLRDALAVDPDRRPTRPPRRAKARRLDAKRRRSRVKDGRGRDWSRDD